MIIRNNSTLAFTRNFLMLFAVNNLVKCKPVGRYFSNTCAYINRIGIGEREYKFAIDKRYHKAKAVFGHQLFNANFIEILYSRLF